MWFSLITFAKTDEQKIMNWKSFLFFVILSMKWVLPVDAQHFDKHVSETMNAWHIHGVSRSLSFSSEVLPVAVPVSMLAYGALKSDKTMIKDAVYIGSSVVEAISVSFAVKQLTDRPRPYMKYPEIIHPYGGHTDSSSFPSNHTAVAFSLATSLSLTYPKWYVIAPSAAWACGVGIARVNQGLHYPTDVIGGAAIGVGCAFLNVYVNRWLNKVLF